MKYNLCCFLLILCGMCVITEKAVSQQLPKPSPSQLAWQQLEVTGFLNYYAAVNPGFNPSGFDARQVIRSLKAGGMKMAILVAKHHYGFCLWPSKYTDYTIARSKWKNGQGDVVKEVADACREYGIKFGVYLSPWDLHEPTYGTPAYNDFYKNQLRELLTSYGDVAEVWLDGYKSKKSKPMDYDWQGYFDLIRQLQPKAVIFSDVGPDVRWVGNEKGSARETRWSTIDVKGMSPGNAATTYLNTGDSKGVAWMPAETDVSIRPGWSYNPAHDSLIKSGKELVRLYYESVGKNSLLLLGVPPNPQGIISEKDAASLKEFRSILDETFAVNLAKGKVPPALTDGKLNTFVTIQEGGQHVYDFKKKISFDRALLQENIADGQRNEGARLEYWDGSSWQPVSSFTTIGYKRLLRFATITTSKVRFTVNKAKAPVELAEVGFYKASDRE